MSRVRKALWLVVLTLLMWSPACAAPPVAPGGGETATHVPSSTPSRTPSLARLAISSFDFEYRHDDPAAYAHFYVAPGDLLYLIHVNVVETTGAHDASIASIKVFIEPSPAPMKWTYPLPGAPGSEKVSAGRSWSTDEQGVAPGYGLEFEIDGSEPTLVGRRASLLIEFTDPAGTGGTVSGTTTIR